MFLTWEQCIFHRFRANRLCLSKTSPREVPEDRLLVKQCWAGFSLFPVHPKGDQSWIFTGRTDAEAEAPILRPPGAKSWLTGKDPNGGKDWRQKERKWQRMKWLDGITYSVQFSSVESLSHVQLFATSQKAAPQASLSITNSQSLLKLMSKESVMPSNHLILYCPLLLPPSIFPSIRVFSNESVLHIKWPKYWSFSFSISPSNEHSGLISF